MTYTQMLFALGADKLIFDHAPGVLSIIGSSLILGSAIVVALQKDSGKKSQDVREGQNDEEAQRGLLGGASDGLESGEDHDRIPLREVQVRALR